MATCIFALEGYQCHNLTHTNSKWCIFHDKKYLQGNEKEVEEEFYKQLYSVSKEEKFSGIGYILPSISIHQDIEIIVDLSESIFSGETDFEGATFSGEADFEYATFSGSTYFSGVTFEDTVDFDQCDFDGIVLMRYTKFPEKHKISRETNKERKTITKNPTIIFNSDLSFVSFTNIKNNWTL